jgi:hypothetical protein
MRTPIKVYQDWKDKKEKERLEAYDAMIQEQKVLLADFRDHMNEEFNTTKEFFEAFSHQVSSDAHMMVFGELWRAHGAKYKAWVDFFESHMGNVPGLRDATTELMRERDAAQRYFDTPEEFRAENMEGYPYNDGCR